MVSFSYSMLNIFLSFESEKHPANLNEGSFIYTDRLWFVFRLDPRDSSNGQKSYQQGFRFQHQIFLYKSH